jgi:hypothetical protein
LEEREVGALRQVREGNGKLDRTAERGQVRRQAPRHGVVGRRAVSRVNRQKDHEPRSPVELGVMVMLAGGGRSCFWEGRGEQLSHQGKKYPLLCGCCDANRWGQRAGFFARAGRMERRGVGTVCKNRKERNSPQHHKKLSV